MDPFVALTIGLVAIGGAMNTADYSTTVSTLQHTTFRSTYDLISNLADTCYTNLIIDSVAERARTGLDYIDGAWAFTLILKLKVFFIEW